MEWLLSPESNLFWGGFAVISFLLSVGIIIFVLRKLRQVSETPSDGKLISAKATKRLLKEIGITMPDDG